MASSNILIEYNLLIDEDASKRESILTILIFHCYIFYFDLVLIKMLMKMMCERIMLNLNKHVDSWKEYMVSWKCIVYLVFLWQFNVLYIILLKKQVFDILEQLI